MATYKHKEFLQRSPNGLFDKTFSEGEIAPYAGVYRCIHCEAEIGTAEGNTLPPSKVCNHRAPTEWLPIVIASHSLFS